MSCEFLFPEKGIDSSALSRGRLRITEQQLGQTALNDTAIKKWHAFRYLADGGGIEPLSSIPLFYATSLEDLCGDTILRNSPTTALSN